MMNVTTGPIGGGSGFGPRRSNASDRFPAPGGNVLKASGADQPGADGSVVNEDVCPFRMTSSLGRDEAAAGNDAIAPFPGIGDQASDQRPANAFAAKAVGHAGMACDD